jgi:hypothetical protein
MFASKDVCSLCPLPRATLADWIAKGFVKPAKVGSTGTGNSHRFSFRQFLGLAVASHLRSTARGCSPAYAGTVVKRFEEMSDQELGDLFSRLEVTSR